MFIRPSLPLSALLCLGLVLNSSCVRGSGPESLPVSHWELSTEARLTYAALLLDQSMRHDNAPGVLEAAQTFLELSPIERPLAEASAWLIASKQLPEARALLEKAVVAAPNDLTLCLLLAETWIEEDNPHKAVEIMEVYRKKHPESEQVRQELGILLLKARRYAEAVQHFSVLPDRLRTPYVRYCHARALIMLNKPAEAARELERAVKDRPDFSEAWVELARAFELAGKPDKARTVYQHLMTTDPDNLEHRLRAVGLELLTNRPAKALELARSGPADSQGFQLAAASLFMEEGRYTEAESVLDLLALSLPADETPDEVWLLRAGIAFEGREDVPAALAALDRITPGSRSLDRALRYRVQIYFAMEQGDKVLETLAEARTIFPDDREFALMEAHFYLTRRDLSNARPRLEALLKRYPEDTDILFTYGGVLEEQGKRAQAMDIMEGILRLDPNHYQALNYVGYTLANMLPQDMDKRGVNAERDLVRAFDLLRRALAIAPDKAYILDSLAWAQYRANQFPEALKTIRAAVKLPENDEWEIWDHYGDIAHASGHSDEARTAWKKAISLNPEKRAVLEKKLKK